jgi:hypothetical protein
MFNLAERAGASIARETHTPLERFPMARCSSAVDSRTRKRARRQLEVWVSLAVGV